MAVAIENALFLEEQGQRAEELARLKEFNENIIESINVGVMVINLTRQDHQLEWRSREYLRPASDRGDWEANHRSF